MNVFKEYATLYDLIYSDKPYSEEADYIASLISSERDLDESRIEIIEVGCGTGKHAALMAEKGYYISGFDTSSEMIALAQARKNSQRLEVQKRLTFNAGRWNGSKQKVNAIYSLFHVVSYHTTEQELVNLFQSASSSLVKGGRFIFDYWYAPAVSAIGPSTRCIERVDQSLKVLRVSRPFENSQKNVIDVHFDIFVSDQNQSASYARVQEIHSMRSFYQDELEQLASGHGMKLVKSEEWMTGKALGSDTWSALMVLEKE